jgi:hypothetical protein
LVERIDQHYSSALCRHAREERLKRPFDSIGIGCVRKFGIDAQGLAKLFDPSAQHAPTDGEGALAPAA